MTFEEFIAATVSRLEEELSADVTVRLLNAQKNNNVKRSGITFLKDGEPLSPTIYLEEYYEKHRQGTDMIDIIAEISALYSELHETPFWLSQDLTCYHEIRELIAYRLINRKKNQELLKKIPHKPFLDLAVVYYLLLEVKAGGSASVLIHREQMDMWGVTEAELHAEAVRNTQEILPMEFKSIDAVIKSIPGFQEMGLREMPQEVFMYVLTNDACNYGAAVILYEGILEQINDLIHESFYILPSSIHELMIVPKSKSMAAAELEKMVREINETQVEEEEILSDHIYCYDKEKEPKLKIVRHDLTK